ncbi:uncharacterized protein [Oscarella lobularis]|uniref:uncharacterized protein n=1 Tax=Oscarella lobularis TaxID=121494 RepID=UPI003313A93C
MAAFAKKRKILIRGPRLIVREAQNLIVESGFPCDDNNKACQGASGHIDAIKLCLLGSLQTMQLKGPLCQVRHEFLRFMKQKEGTMNQKRRISAHSTSFCMRKSARHIFSFTRINRTASPDLLVLKTADRLLSDVVCLGD